MTALEATADVRRPGFLDGIRSIAFPTQRDIFMSHVREVQSSLNISLDHLVGVIVSATPRDLDSLDETSLTIWAGSVVCESHRPNIHKRAEVAQVFREALKSAQKQAYAAAYVWQYGGEESGRRDALELLIPLLQRDVSEEKQRKFVHATATVVNRIGGKDRADQFLAWYTKRNGSHVVYENS